MIFRSPQSIRSTSQLSEYSNGRGPHHDDDRLMSPEDDDQSEDASGFVKNPKRYTVGQKILKSPGKKKTREIK